MKPLHFTTLTMSKNNWILEIWRKQLVPGGGWWDPALIVIDWFQKAPSYITSSLLYVGSSNPISYLRLEVIVDFQLNHPSADKYSRDFRCNLQLGKKLWFYCMKTTLASLHSCVLQHFLSCSQLSVVSLIGLPTPIWNLLDKTMNARGQWTLGVGLLAWSLLIMPNISQCAGEPAEVGWKTSHIPIRK